MKFVVALIRHETNTFSPVSTQLIDFRRGTGENGPAYGEAARKACEGTNSAAAAYLDLAREMGAEVEFAICANAVPSGLVTLEAFESLCDTVVHSVSQGCDAVLLDLHGAMVVDGFPDAEGELLRRLRECAPAGLPIGVALDFHANFSAELIRHATAIAGYCTYPHIDIYETGVRVGRSIRALLEKRSQPVMLWRRLPMLTHMLRQAPSMQPMKDIMDRAMQAEKDGQVCNASVFGGFPLSDIDCAGLSVVIVAERAQIDVGNRLLNELCELAWSRRADFVFPAESVTASVAYAKTLEQGPVILVDHGDNCGAGGTTDIMAVLEEVLRQGLEDVVAGPFCDPATVAVLVEQGVNAEVTVDLGGKTDMPALGLTGQPLRLTGVVECLTDGEYTVTGPMFTGMRLSLGRTAVLRVGTVRIFISERPQEPNDTGVFTHAGVDPAQSKYVLLKSRQHFRAGFEPFARHIVLISGPGVCSSDYGLFPFKHLSRPMYPLDADASLAQAESWAHDVC
ncbi:M81 family metallopeptidase [Comamonas sp.]|uniref:M81 family metallopeptidase n=1 Tax=Comamonas sp. TaxID=34028 RepID=UPI003A9098A6